MSEIRFIVMPPVYLLAMRTNTCLHKNRCFSVISVVPHGEPCLPHTLSRQMRSLYTIDNTLSICMRREGMDKWDFSFDRIDCGSFLKSTRSIASGLGGYLCIGLFIVFIHYDKATTWDELIRPHERPRQRSD